MTFRLRHHARARGALITSVALPLALLGTLAATSPAWAQKSLGGGAGSGPVMTREELRTCLKQQEALKTQVAEYERQRSEHEKERAAILETKTALDAERGGVVADAAKINDLNRRASEVAQRIADWNDRWQAFEKNGRGGPTADRQRRSLVNEQRELNAENAAIEKEREALGGVGEGAKEINAKVDALNARTVAWNENNKRIVKRGEDVTQERDLWAAECGNRRYREDDEIAIKQGK